MVVKISCTLSLDQDVLDWARSKSESDRRSLSQFVSDTLRAAMGEKETDQLFPIEKSIKKEILKSFSRLMDIMEKRNSDQLSIKDIETFILEESKK